jgi:hypothetical protein
MYYGFLLILGLLSRQIIISEQLGDVFRVFQPFVWREFPLDWSYSEDRGSICEIIFFISGLNLIKLFGAYLDAKLSQNNRVRRLNKRLKVLQDWARVYKCVFTIAAYVFGAIQIIRDISKDFSL